MRGVKSATASDLHRRMATVGVLVELEANLESRAHLFGPQAYTLMGLQVGRGGAPGTPWRRTGSGADGGAAQRHDQWEGVELLRTRVA